MCAIARASSTSLRPAHDRGTRLVMLSRPMAIDKNTPMSVRSGGPVASIGWSNNGIGYSLVKAKETLSV